MQYILTADEYSQLEPRHKTKVAMDALVIARKKLLHVTGFKCVHGDGGGYGRCNGCPCLPSEEEIHAWEMNIGARQELNDRYELICTLPKSFSK